MKSYENAIPEFNAVQMKHIVGMFVPQSVEKLQREWPKLWFSPKAAGNIANDFKERYTDGNQLWSRSQVQVLALEIQKALVLLSIEEGSAVVHLE